MNKITLLAFFMLLPAFGMAAKKGNATEGFQFGWLAGDHTGLLKITLPKFMSQKIECELHKIIKGIDYCGTTDGMLLVSGMSNVEGKDLILSVTGSAWGLNLIPKSKSTRNVGERNKGSWEGGLLDYKEIKLDGHPAYRMEVENRMVAKENGLIRNCVIVYYEYENIRGDFSLCVAEKLKSGEVMALPQKEWPEQIRKDIDDAIKSFVFLKKVKE
jgi:hypothetical protein